MTLSTQTPRVVVIGNGTRGPYSIVDSTSQAIRAISTSHIRLTRFDASTDDNADGSLLVENTDYTIGGTQDARTFTLASTEDVLTSSQRILVERVQGYTQDLDLTTGGAFNASSVESRLDKHLEYMQELKARLDRTVSLQYADSSTNVALPSPPTSATKFLGHNTSGEIAHVTAADLGVDLVLGSGWETVLGLPAAGTLDNLSGVRFVATYAALTALSTATGLSDNSIYCTYARATEEDGGFGFWRYDSASTTTADGGTILAIDGGGAGRFFRLYADDIHVEWFGAKGDNSTDDSTAIQAACLCAQTKVQSYQPTLDVVGTYIQSVGKVIFQPGKIYKIGTTIALYSGNHWVAWQVIFRAHASLGSSPMVQATSGGGTYNGRFVTIEGAKFEGGAKHIDIDNGNIGSSRILFLECEFWGASTRAVHQKAESARVDYVRCTFQQNAHSLLIEHTVNGSASQTFMWDCLVQQPRWSANNQNAIENRGYYTNATDNGGGSLHIFGGAFSGFEEATNSYTGLAWIKANECEEVSCYNVRFPRELGAVCAIDNYCSFRTADTAPPTVIRLEDCELADMTSNSSDRVHGVRLHSVPNMLAVSRCKTSLYVPIVEFATGTTPSSLISGGTRDLVKIDIKGNFSAFETSVSPVSDYIPDVLRPYDVWLKGSVIAHKNASDQASVADATATKVTFATEALDTAGIWDAANSKLTGIIGQVSVTVNLYITGTIAAGGANQIILYKNGSAHKYGPITHAVSTSELSLSATFIVDLTALTDYLEVYVYVDTSAGTSTVSGSVASTLFQAMQI